MSDAAFREALERAAKVSKPWRCAECGGGYPCVCRIEASLAKEEEAQVSAMPECNRLIASFRAQSNVGEAIGCAHEAINALRAALLAAEAELRRVNAELDVANATVMNERAERDALVELVRDVACSGVAFEDKRLDYVEIQVDTDTWAQARAVLAREEAK